MKIIAHHPRKAPTTIVDVECFTLVLDDGTELDLRTVLRDGSLRVTASGCGDQMIVKPHASNAVSLLATR